ncbi:golgi SNAP receptor complex member 2 like protein memb-1 [Ditylenchus destructor]|nr:golgi SNAP receptor complex member 2 like protein memb-1 [Ditylenchus destructor]
MESASNESDIQPILQEVNRELTSINEILPKLDNLVSKERPEKRRTSKYRLDQLRYDVNSIDSAVLSLQTKLTQKWRTAAEREELLTRRFKANDTHLDFEGTELLVNDKLKQSHSAVDELIAHGNAVLDSIRIQGGSLHGVKRKVLDIGQTLGLSGTTLRMIEKRLDEDWIIFIVLCIVFIIFMYCFYRFWKG